MSDGRTSWWPKDAGWWRRELVVALGEEFSASGPAVLDWLSCEAGAQFDGGRVKTGVKSIARGCFVDVVTVRHVLSRAVAIGALDDYEEADGRISCRISGWQKDNERGKAAVRQAAKRARDAGEVPANTEDPENDDSVTSHGESRSVTDRHDESLTSHKRKSLTTPLSPPRRGRRRDRESRASKQQSWAEAFVRSLDVEPTRQLVAEAVAMHGLISGANVGEVTDEAVLERLRRRNPSWPVPVEAAA